MLGSSVAELDHSAFEMGIYGSSPTVPVKSAAATKLPRAPIVGTFFAGVAPMATRVIKNLKKKWRNLEHRATVLLLYRTACKKSIKSLELAFRSKNLGAIHKHLEDFFKFRTAQKLALEGENPALVTAFEKIYHHELKGFLKSWVEALEEISKQLVVLEKNTDLEPLHRHEARLVGSLVKRLMIYAEPPARK